MPQGLSVTPFGLLVMPQGLLVMPQGPLFTPRAPSMVPVTLFVVWLLLSMVSLVHEWFLYDSLISAGFLFSDSSVSELIVSLLKHMF